jgi:glycosyltransferase involved in cell wall biosynthesis
MRILVISDLYPPVAFGGYESETAALVEGLRERHDVLVLTSERDAGKAPAGEEGVRRVLPYAGPRRHEALLAPAKARRAAQLTQEALDAHRPDLVYVANSVAIPHAAPLTAAAAGLPIVYRMSELFMASSLYTGDRYLRTLLPGQAGLRAPWAAAMRVANARLGLDPRTPHRAGVSWASNALREKVALPDSIDAAIQRTIHPASSQEASFAAIERRPAGARTFLYLGRMTTAKGIEVAYRALSAIEGSRLVTVGTAPAGMDAKLRSLAVDIGVSDWVDNRGRLATPELAEVLATVDAIVLPTVEWDVFPLVLIEAGLARVPIVASRIGGVPEAVTDGEHALLVEPGDARALAAALQQTFDDPVAAAGRTERAFARMRELSVERYRRESEQLILEVAETAG